MKHKALLLLAVLFATLSLQAQDKVTKTVLELGKTDNRTMEHADYIARNIGGRIVGSHMLNHAEDWVAEQFRAWGLEVRIQEAVTINVGFDRGPWFGRMLSEDGMTLHFGTPAYTAGTRGPQKGRVYLEPKTQRDFDRIKGALRAPGCCWRPARRAALPSMRARRPIPPVLPSSRPVRKVPSYCTARWWTPGSPASSVPRKCPCRCSTTAPCASN